MVISQELHVHESVSIILLGYFDKADPGGQLECEPVPVTLHHLKG